VRYVINHFVNGLMDLYYIWNACWMRLVAAESECKTRSTSTTGCSHFTPADYDMPARIFLNYARKKSCLILETYFYKRKEKRTGKETGKRSNERKNQPADDSNVTQEILSSNRFLMKFEKLNSLGQIYHRSEAAAAAAEMGKILLPKIGRFAFESLVKTQKEARQERPHLAESSHTIVYGAICKSSSVSDRCALSRSHSNEIESGLPNKLDV
jgi:hypothetical protein